MKIIGHRGARGLAPENTIASLAKALEHDVDMIEFDVRVTANKVPVLHHDAIIKINDVQLTIDQHDYQELHELKNDLTSLDEALEFLDDNVRIYLEIKPQVDTRPIVEILKNFKGDMLVGSKSQTALLEVHDALPKIPLIVIEPWSGVRARRRARQLKTSYVAMNQRWLWRGFIQPQARSGWKLIAYTINDPSKAKRRKTYGLYGVVTDYPDRLR